MRKGLLGREEALKVVERVLVKAPGELNEVSIRGGVSNLTRFSDNYIHQNVAESGQIVSVKVIYGQKIGAASTNSLDEESIESTIAAASRIAELQRPNTEFLGIPGPSEYQEVETFFDSTFGFTPMQRATGVKTIVDAAVAKGFRAAGSYTCGASEVCLANSLGLRAYHASTSASLRTVVMSNTGSGCGDASAPDVTKIDAAEVAREAVELCDLNQNPVEVPPGEYEVVLKPRAVADLLNYVIRGGFSASAVQEGRSFLVGKLGQKLFAGLFSLWDDGLDPRGFPVPFDMEGSPKKKVLLVERGVAKELLYDFRSAKKEGRESTGHGGFGGWGPVATNLFMASGEASLDDLIKMTKRGILITRLNYTNMAHPAKVLVTGTTRDGTFLIEDGKVVRPAKNFRFTESALRVFGSMDAATRETVRAGRGANVPAIHVPAFNFTGVTEF